MAASFPFAAVVIEWGKPRESRHLFTREGQKFGHADEQGKSGALARTRHANEKIEPFGKIGMSAQDVDEAFEFERAAFFKARDSASPQP
jgi:hypothetical protein